jgi:hypothetical protein
MFSRGKLEHVLQFHDFTEDGTEDSALPASAQTGLSAKPPVICLTVGVIYYYYLFKLQMGFNPVAVVLQ